MATPTPPLPQRHPGEELPLAVRADVMEEMATLIATARRYGVTDDQIREDFYLLMSPGQTDRPHP